MFPSAFPIARFFEFSLPRFLPPRFFVFGLVPGFMPAFALPRSPGPSARPAFPGIPIRPFKSRPLFIRSHPPLTAPLCPFLTAFPGYTEPKKIDDLIRDASPGLLAFASVPGERGPPGSPFAFLVRAPIRPFHSPFAPVWPDR